LTSVENFRSKLLLSFLFHLKVLLASELNFRSAVTLALFASERNYKSAAIFNSGFFVSLFELRYFVSFSCRSTFDSADIYA